MKSKFQSLFKLRIILKLICQETEVRREREFREMIRREYQQKVAALALEAISPMGTPRNVVGTRTPQPTPPATPRAAKNTGSNLAISNIAGSNSINASSSSTRPMQELSSPKSARSMLSRRSPSTSPNRPRRDQAPQKTFLDEMQDERQRQADAQGTAMALRQLMPDQVITITFIILQRHCISVCCFRRLGIRTSFSLPNYN